MHKVSVIIPCYNNDQYIEKAIQSVVNQTLDDIEVIVINNGSTDKSWTVISSMMEKFPDKVFGYSKEHGNVSSSRNFGLSKIHGEYFGFLDGDDYCDSDMYESLYNKAKETDADICYSNYYFTYEDHEVLYEEPEYHNEYEMMVYMFTALWNKIYKTETFRRNAVEFVESYNEDVVYLYKNAPYLAGFAKVDKAFVHYVQRQGSLIHVYDDKVKQMVHNWRTIYSYYKKHGIYEKYYSELEYATIKYMLGQPFKRASKIKGKERITTIDLLWENLNQNFPNWKQNKYLNQFKDNKHRFFRMVNQYNYHFLSLLLKVFSK